MLHVTYIVTIILIGSKTREIKFKKRKNARKCRVTHSEIFYLHTVVNLPRTVGSI